MARRNTQEPVEVATKATGVSVNRRVTQEPVEVATKATGTSVNRRLTQIVIEVPIIQPVQPFGSDARLNYPLWSPAAMQSPVEAQSINYASYFGIHAHKITLGKRGIWQRFQRR
jgi:hypothetical protein